MKIAVLIWLIILTVMVIGEAVYIWCLQGIIKESLDITHGVLAAQGELLRIIEDYEESSDEV